MFAEAHIVLAGLNGLSKGRCLGGLQIKLGCTRLRNRFEGEADRVALSTPGGISDDDLAAVVEEVGP